MIVTQISKYLTHTDASGKGLGAVLEQEGEEGKNHPVAYASRTLSKHEKNYGITDLEALGVVWALRHFRAYLLGHACVVVTDHAPLRALLKAKHQSGKLARWGQTIAEFNVEIKYRPGRQHSNADALSRCPCSPDCRHCDRLEDKESSAQVVMQEPSFT